MNVYVIASEGGMCKIGKANDPAKRVRELATGHPYRLSVAHVFQMVSVERSLTVERLAHEALSAKRMAGEWFQVTPDEAAQAISKIVNLSNIKDEKFEAQTSLLSGHIHGVVDVAIKVGAIQAELLEVVRSGRGSASHFDAIYHRVMLAAAAVQGLMDYDVDDDI